MMARPRRIEYPGAFYHVTTRGNRRQAIFKGDDDRFFFLSCLRQAHERFGVVVHVYCLMENHYHLFLETPEGNLSRIMHLVNLKYSNYFNLKHSNTGHTFQSRFRATLVQAKEYAREVAPYIHLNPVRAGLVHGPEDYEWSNYREYLGLASPEPWTSTSFVLRLFGPSPSEAMKAYERYVVGRASRGLSDLFAGAKQTGILGKPDFVEQMRKSPPNGSRLLAERDYLGIKGSRPRPTLQQIRTQTDVVMGRESSFSRKIAIYVSHKATDHSLKAIGEFFGIGESGISDICRRTRKEVVHNGTLARIVEEIEIRLRLECEKEKERTRSSQA
jgi:REP element-mobilizing transposase RayT